MARRKSSKRSTPPFARRRSDPVSDASLRHLAGIDYSGFGTLGPDFQQLHEDTWQAITESWERLPEQIEMENTRIRRPPLSEMLIRHFDRSGWMLDRLVALYDVIGGISPQGFVNLWGSLSKIFSPTLKEGEQLVTDRAGLTLRSTFMKHVFHQVMMRQDILLRRLQLNTTCHGPFTDREISYLLRAHPHLLEVGCGSGYFAAEFSRRGGTIIAQDNNNYGITEGLKAPWTQSLLNEKQLEVTDSIGTFVRRHAANRTLLISWPEPGSPFPSTALESYADSGGKNFVVKLGAFVGGGAVGSTSSPNHQLPAKAGDNVVWFLQLLTEDWKEANDPHRPQWSPQKFGNNLLVFERK